MSRQHANGRFARFPEPGESLVLSFNLLTLRVVQVLECSVRREADAQLSAINVVGRECLTLPRCYDASSRRSVPSFEIERRATPHAFSQMPPPSTRVRRQFDWENVQNPLLG